MHVKLMVFHMIENSSRFEPNHRSRVGCSVIIGTYGDIAWYYQARSLAGKVTQGQYVPPHEVICVHADTLAEARNEGANRARTDWLIFLDADDELDPMYCYEMMRIESGALRRPSVLGFMDGRQLDPEPVLGSRYPLLQRNFLIIGTMVNRDIFMSVGGFDDEYPCLEDWELWLKCVCYGDADIVDCPKAIYKINTPTDGRNGHPDQDQIAKKIRRKYATVWQAVKNRS